ncbi:MAG: M15 family metallopeptidase [Acidimicrobiales bacterium]
MQATAGAGGFCARRLGPLAAVLLLLLLATAGPAGARTDDELRRERADVLAKKAQVAGQVDALESDDAKVSASLDALTQNVGAQSTAMQQADAAAQKARQAAELARDAEALALESVRAAEEAMRKAAVSTYTAGSSEALEMQGDDINDINDISRARAYGAVATGRRTDALDRLEAARKDLAQASEQRKTAAAAAERQLAAAQQRLASLNRARAEQLGYAEKVADRLDRTLGEAQSLAGVDAALSAEITKREAALAAKLAAQAAPRSRGGSVSIVGGGDIVSVRGIQVHRSIAGQLAALLSASDAAGITLTGGGYRSAQAQIETRRNNGCPDVYNSPASACSPPTARPGQSMHEQGLAIDFQCNGRLITSRSGPCWTWLSANAGRFGFRNLPSEPWHWSTNGN